MALRVENIRVRSSTNIEIIFNKDINPTGIVRDNFIIETSFGRVEQLSLITDPEVDGNIISISTTPQRPLLLYKLSVINLTNNKLRALSDASLLIDDGASNVIYFFGTKTANPILDQMLDALRPMGVYSVDDPNAVVNKSLSAISEELKKAQQAIGEIRSDKYLCVRVDDEELVRGTGPTDRLANEGVFSIDRIGKTSTGTTSSDSINGTTIDGDIINLNQKVVIDEIVVSNGGFTFSVINGPVIEMTDLVLIKQGSGNQFVYDVSRFRYFLRTDRYDKFAFPLETLEENQIRLSEEASLATNVFGNPLFPEPEAGDTFRVTYKYELGGRQVIEDSVKVTQTIRNFIEPLPFVANNFFLSNFPIVNSAGQTSFFRDPLSTVSFIGGNTGTVFQVEVDFATTTPVNIGEYAINYTTGEVIVGGEPQIGTTNEAGQIQYDFIREFTETLDFDVNTFENELAFNSSRNLNGQIVDIKFNIEEIFREGVDYIKSSHVEVIDERADNRIIDDFTVQTLNIPITSVRRIYNETTGEIYTLDRFNDTTIYFTGRDAPRRQLSEFERVNFARINRQDILTTSISLTPAIPGATIFQVNFNTPGILNKNQTKIGSSFDSSVSISNVSSASPFFVKELYYDDNLSSSINLGKLTTLGDYLIDYTNGILYVVVPDGTDTLTRLGSISFKYNKILTKNNHVLAVEALNKRISTREVEEIIYTPTNISDDGFIILDLEKAGEFAQNALDGSNTITVDHNIAGLRAIYPVTILGGSTVPDLDNPFNITGVEFERNVIDINSSSISLAFGEQVFIDYEYGTIFSTYEYLADEILLTYEYGDNSIDWSIGSAFNNARRRLLASGLDDCGVATTIEDTPEDLRYFVTYQYGASRESLINNFGNLTNIPFLSDNLPATFPRETYRNALKGLFEAFTLGPTLPSIKQLVNKFTLVDPNITERAFQSFILSRDNLFLQPPTVNVNGEDISPTDKETLQEAGASFASGCFGEGLIFNDSTYITMPFNSNFPIAEGTLEFCTKPQWNGRENDASITFDFTIDGYGDGYFLLEDNSTFNIKDHIYIGGFNKRPNTVPFTLNRLEDEDVLGVPTLYLSGNTGGIFIWFDTFQNKWSIRTRTLPGDPDIDVYGSIVSSSDFASVLPIITTGDGYVTGIDAYGCNDGYGIPDGYRLETGFGSSFDGYDGYGITLFLDGAFSLLEPPQPGSVLNADYVTTEASGGGDDLTTNIFPIGIIDGANTAFTTPDPFVSGSLMVYRNGTRLEPTEYTEGASSFTLSEPPDIGARLIVDYIINSGVSPKWVIGETPTGVIDGINDIFFISSPQREGSIRLFRDRLRLKPNVDYTEFPGGFIMLIIPQPGAEFIVDYILGSTSDGDGDIWNFNVDPIGPTDGSNLDFTLSGPFVPDNLLVWLDGLRQSPTLDFVEFAVGSSLPSPEADFAFFGPDYIRSLGNNEFEFQFFTGPGDTDGVNFRSDERHYFFDWASSPDRNRFSIYKDGQSFLNFEVHDRKDPLCDIRDTFRISSDICEWRFGEPHQIAVSWRLNTAKELDELHLFVDGLEVPNLVTFGSRRNIFGFKFGDVEEEFIVQNANGTETFADVEVTDLENERFALFINNLTTQDGYAREMLVNSEYSVDAYNKVINFIELVPSIGGGLTQQPKALNLGDTVSIRTFGLTQYRVFQQKFLYGNQSTFQSGFPDPIDVTKVRIKAVTLSSVPIVGSSLGESGGGIAISDGMVMRDDKTVTEFLRVKDSSQNSNDRQFVQASFRMIKVLSVIDKFGTEKYFTGAEDGRIRNNINVEFPSDSDVITDDIVRITYLSEAPLITQPSSINTGRTLTLDFSGQDIVEALQGRSLRITINGEAFDENGVFFSSDEILFTDQDTVNTNYQFHHIDEIRLDII